jgi:DNA repair protein RecN (Recombination protein N)
MLRTVGEALIGIHGQQDGRELTSPESHLGFIDSFADLSNLVETYGRLTMRSRK